MKKFTLVLLSIFTVLTMNATNLLLGWDGNGVTGDLSKPNDVGWLNTTTSVPWNTANGSGGCRFRDAGIGFTAGTFKNAADSSINDARHMMLRFDNGAYSSSIYAYPVTLEANTTYTFSLDFLCGGSATPPKNLTIGASSTSNLTGKINSVTVTSTNSATYYKKGSLIFTSGTAAGTYYIIISGDYAWFGVTNLNLEKNADQLTELNSQFEKLSLGDLSSGVTTDLVLPTTLGTNGVTASWKSSNNSVIDSVGHVTRPAIYDENVSLTATLAQTVGTTVYTLVKTFDVKVLGVQGTPELVAHWDFSDETISKVNDTLKVKDVSGSNFEAVLYNEASIRTIGNSTKFNVLDLGAGKGFMDLGKEIGKAIYHMSDFSMMGYFYIDASYTNLNANGNYFWNFSNSQDVGTSRDGFMYGRLNGNLAAGISAAASPSTPAASGQATPTGAWHHIAFVQTGSTGTVYLDGVQVAQNVSMPNPATALKKDSLQGTRYNWLGRSCWPGDAYLQKALLYDFQLYSIPVTADNLIFDFGVTDKISQLTNAFVENPDYKAAELQTEASNLTLGDISALTSDINLPVQGSTDPTVAISWKTSCADYISSTGKVTQPKYHDFGVTLTATLKKGIQSVNKVFEANVKMLTGTGFNNDLLVKYDFSTVSGSTVTDKAEKKFEGQLMNDASIRVIGTPASGQFAVLDLGDSIGYFDLGPEVGKVLYGTTDYTMNAYFRVDTAYTGLASNGNFLWSFSNSDKAMTDQNGYIIASMKNSGVSTSKGYYLYASGNRAVNYGLEAEKGSWHSFTYTQSGTTGTVYIDGMLMSTADTIIYNPSTALKKAGFTGTPFNWIGRSNYVGDVYLRQTLVYDFRLYNRALSDIEILALELNVGEQIVNLNAAYAASPNASVAVVNTKESRYKSYSNSGTLNITGLTGNEKVEIYDIAGRLISAANAAQYKLNAGIYLVKINNEISKVVVR